MRIYILITALILAGVSGYSQQLHFAYMQTDTHKPFYVSLNKKNYSSTASGYIILPKLQNGDYPVRIGFAKNEEAEQEYLLQVKDNDQGFLIKDFGDKGWGLFNLQTMAVQYAGTAAQEKAKLAAAEKAEAEQRQRKQQEELQTAETQRRNDSLKTVALAQQAYADSIAAIAASNRQRIYEDSITRLNSTAQQNRYNDSIANAKSVVRETERLEKLADSTARAQAAIAKKEQAEAAARSEKDMAIVKENERLEKLADSTAKAQAAAIQKQKEKEEVAAKIENANGAAKPSDIVPLKKNDTVKNIQLPVLIQQLFTDTGWHYAYTIINNNQRETVDVFIPSAQPKLPVVTPPVIEKEVVPDNKVATDTIKFLNINMSQDTASNSTDQSTENKPVFNNPVIAGNATASTQQSEIKDSIPVMVEKPILNSNCRSVADEKDFLTLRRKIASVVGTDAMLIAARKQLKEKCYTTEQLRNLCVLFLTDAGRYQFLDAAYPFAFDAYRYGTLQDLLIDGYYIQRFKTMLR